MRANGQAVVGRTISHYAVLALLGQGGMGVVYKARDLRLGRLVALKFLSAHLILPEDLARFEQEARAISALNHPHIATIFDLDQIDNQRFLVLEYLPGGTLGAKIRRLRSLGRRLTILEAVEYALQIGDGLAHAHYRGIVNRDVKTENVMFTEDGTVKLTDFGLAKLRGENLRITRAGSLLGTVAYMSPEQARGQEADQRSDIFSFGVVLYEMLAGRLPFRASSDVALLQEIVHASIPPLEPERDDVPEALQGVLWRALEKDPEARWQAMEELLGDLRQLRRALEMDADQDRMVETRTDRTLPLQPAGRPATHRKAPWLFDIPSVAVLPFADLSPEGDQEYFCDGLAEELISALSQLPNLRTVARSSAFRFRGKAYDVREIGQQLGVRTVLEGSVRKSGTRLRITVQLVNASDGYHLWSTKFDGDLRDIFSIQEDISRAVADSLKVKLAGEMDKRLVESGTRNLEAYSLYLRGRHYWNQRTPDGLQKGIDHFQQAIARDPAYALAYSGLADCYVLLAFHGPFPPRQFWSEAKEAALKALALDDLLAAAHASLGQVLTVYEWDWTAGERELLRATELNPGYTTAYHWYAGNWLTPRLRLDEALAVIKHGLELDPLSLIMNSTLGSILHFRHEYEQAVEQYQKTLELDPNFYVANWQLARAYEQMGRFEEAIGAAEKARAMGSPVVVGTLGRIYAAMGRRDDALRLLHEVQELSRHQYVAPMIPAIICRGLRDHEAMFAWLEKALEERSVWILFLRVDQIYEDIRGHPRFQSLMQRIGLLEATTTA
jgi:serine/threonine protein kinase